jgi:hypothetical protein
LAMLAIIVTQAGRGKRRRSTGDVMIISALRKVGHTHPMGTTAITTMSQHTRDATS